MVCAVSALVLEQKSKVGQLLCGYERKIIAFFSFRPNKGGWAQMSFLLFNPFNVNVRNQHLGRATGEHFRRPGHGVENMKFPVLEKVKSLDPIYGRERDKLFKKFDKFYCGINKEP